MVLIASATARAQVLAGPSRPAGVPEGYVITPSGYFHPSCVRQMAEGEALLEDGRVLQHADGTLENIPSCDYPRYTAHGEIGGEGPLTNYIEWAQATTSTSYGGLTATWVVPPAPASNDGQTVYFFPGLDDINDTVTILQPVLGWNSFLLPGAWSIASWNCCVPSTSTNWHSPAVSVSPGDEIKGIIWDTCGAGTVSCPTWKVITEDVSTGRSTTLSDTPSEGQTFNWAFAGALEVSINLIQCSDYPPNGALTFSDVALYDYNFDRVSNPGWSFTNKASGLAPQCGYGGQVAPTQATLDYSSFITLASFNFTDGAVPYAGLIQATNGNLYGTTQIGGAGGEGTIFQITPSGTLTTLYSFCSQSNCADGEVPYAGLIQATKGDLYGTTTVGGTHDEGTVFKITPAGTLTTLYSFCSQSECADGAEPYAGLVQASNGNLYGTTLYGGTGANCYFGAEGCGTVFSITPGGTLTTLYSFCTKRNCADGALPYAGLIQGTDGSLYGTASAGGYEGQGTFFKITPTGTLTTLYEFCGLGCPNEPEGALVQAASGEFYGTTFNGGSGSNGTVFSITPGGKLTTLYSFCTQSNCTDGALPYAGLVLGTDGNFYGTTVFGGANGYGTIFQITPSGTLTTLYSFCAQSNCTDGSNSEGGLVQGTSGDLYGTTCCGADGWGTVFRLYVGLGPFVETLPTSGKVGGAVKILGTNLTGATSVSFNGTAAAFTVVSASEITTAVPAGATTGAVQVVTPSGTLSSNVPFRVQ